MTARPPRRETALKLSWQRLLSPNWLTWRRKGWTGRLRPDVAGQRPSSWANGIVGTASRSRIGWARRARESLAVTLVCDRAQMEAASRQARGFAHVERGGVAA